MQVILQGSLRHFPAAELLRFLCTDSRKGTLDLESQGSRTRILFEGQTIVWAESSKVPDAVDAVLDTFAWDGGTFTLLDTFALPDNAAPLALTLDGLHDEAKRRAESGGYRDETLFRVVENPEQQQAISLNGEQFKILFRLATGRTLRELVAELGADREQLVTRLEELEELGLIESGSEEPVNPFAPKTDPIPVQDEADATRVERATISRKTIPPKTLSRKNTIVGSMTPDDAPDSVYPLLDAECVIGRAPGSGITVTDGSVSSQHAKLTRTAEGFVLEDLKSRNGTFVNGEKVDKPRLLVNGDLVRFGKVIMTFNVAQEAKIGERTAPEIQI